MSNWKEAFGRALCSGTAAGMLSAAMLAICGKVERRSAAAPLNGPSQWLWGRLAPYHRQPSLRYTLVGYLIHHGASIGWAVLHERYVQARIVPPGTSHRLLAGMATAAFACAVDFQIARGRFKPGFEKQLSRASLALVYAAFGAGLAFQCRRRKRSTLD